MVVVANEQRVDRLQGYDAQKPYYSSEKKAHKVEGRVVVDTRGRIMMTGPSVPGGADHDLMRSRDSGSCGAASDCWRAWRARTPV